MPKDTIEETVRTIRTVERRIELKQNDIRDLLVRAGVVPPLDKGDQFDVRVTVPSGADWSGMDLDLDLDYAPVVVTITRRTETVE